MSVLKALFGIASVTLGVLALFASGVIGTHDRQQSDTAQAKTRAPVQCNHNDGASTRGASRSRTYRESARRHVDPIFNAP